MKSVKREGAFRNVSAKHPHVLRLRFTACKPSKDFRGVDLARPYPSRRHTPDHGAADVSRPGHEDSRRQRCQRQGETGRQRIL